MPCYTDGRISQDRGVLRLPIFNSCGISLVQYVMLCTEIWVKSTSEISVSTETRTGRTSTASGTARTGHRLINLIVRLAQRPQMGSFLRNAGSQYLLRKASVSLGSSSSTWYQHHGDLTSSDKTQCISYRSTTSENFVFSRSLRRVNAKYEAWRTCFIYILQSG